MNGRFFLEIEKLTANGSLVTVNERALLGLFFEVCNFEKKFLFPSTMGVFLVGKPSSEKNAVPFYVNEQ